MIQPEEHVSPDGSLTLVVEPLEDGDVAIGFRGFAWHTHADILASLNSKDERTAVREFVDSVINNQSLIAVQLIDGKVRDVWVADDTTSDCKYIQSNEAIQFRDWSGRVHWTDGTARDGT